jgi:hypothetical protein
MIIVWQWSGSFLCYLSTSKANLFFKCATWSDGLGRGLRCTSASLWLGLRLSCVQWNCSKNDFMFCISAILLFSFYFIYLFRLWSGAPVGQHIPFCICRYFPPPPVIFISVSCICILIVRECDNFFVLGIYMRVYSHCWQFWKFCH